MNKRKKTCNKSLYSRVASLITAVVVSYLFIFLHINIIFHFYSASSNIPAVRLVYTVAMTAATTIIRNHNNSILIYIIHNIL